MPHIAFVATGTLFDIADPRPSLYGEKNLKRAAEKLTTDIERWCVNLGDSSFSDEEYDDMVDCLVKNNANWDDGYSLCKRIERDFRMDGDSELVEICDQIPFYLNEEYLKVIKQWVKHNGILLNLSVGDIIEASVGEGIHKYMVQGEIIKLYPEKAEYCVYCESRGHVRKGNGTLGSIVKCENVLRVIRNDD